MPHPPELSPATERCGPADSGPLDPTLARPDTVYPAWTPGPGRDANFGPPAQPGELGTLGRYRVLKKLGAGGMGAVYLGSDTLLTRRVALKVMLPEYARDPEARERFLREARAAAVVTSDHVVTIHDVGEARGTPFIAMEYLTGYPLDQFLRAQGNPSLAHVFRIGRETALGLAAAHKLGLVHRDVKPGNIWLEAPKGRVKLLDFGLARVADDETHLTASGLVVGTPAYMSPEQARNQKVDARSDLFSLGVMLYRLATGRMPFGGDTTMALLTSLAVDEPPPVREVKPSVPEPLAAVVTKLLAKHPGDRYQTAREVVAALLAAERLPDPVAVAVVPVRIGPPPDGAMNAASGPSEPVLLALDDETERVPARAERKSKPKRARGSAWWPLAAAAGSGLAAVAVLAALLWPAKGAVVVECDDPATELVFKKDGAVVRDRTRERDLRLRAGAYTVELAEPKAGRKVVPDRFELTSNTPVRVRVVAEAKPAPPGPVSDADRRGAEWVVSVGGAVTVSGEDGEIRTKDRLPRTPFQLLGVRLQDAKPVTDAGLANLKDCKHILALNLLYCAEVTDAGLAHLKVNPNLLVLSIASGPRVTDAGLAQFKGCKKLTRLELFASPLLTDAALAHFNGCTELDHINLGYNPQFTDAGMANFSRCTKVTYLNLHDCMSVSDAGVANFAGCTGLTYINLQGGPARGDAALAPFQNCPGVRNLFVQNTRVKSQAVVDFLRTHPQCRIEHNGGVLSAK